MCKGELINIKEAYDLWFCESCSLYQIKNKGIIEKTWGGI